MSQLHCIQCPAWAEIREGLDLSNIEGMVTFFTRLMEQLNTKKSESGRGAMGWTAGHWEETRHIYMYHVFALYVRYLSVEIFSPKYSYSYSYSNIVTGTLVVWPT